MKSEKKLTWEYRKLRENYIPLFSSMKSAVFRYSFAYMHCAFVAKPRQKSFQNPKKYWGLANQIWINSIFVMFFKSLFCGVFVGARKCAI